jgi:N-acyl-phosphatidylethanolamine-hydrolysing phospholipase D
VRRTASAVLVVVVLALGFATVPVSLDAQAPGREGVAHHLKRGFRNLNAHYSYSLLERTRRLIGRLGEPAPVRGKALDVLPNNGAAVRANGQHPTITWIGHSTFLVQIDGVNILTDPIWADRASPVRFAGPERLVPPGMRFEDLPPIHAVVISHDHYDHLDAGTVERLTRDHRPTFFVPLGVKALVADMGARSVVELDWWETGRLGSLTFVCTPAQHSSGRTLTDQNLRLWSSWVLLGPSKRLFFAGDTGYFAGMREIGDRLGPFDLAAIPIGGYSSWAKGHPNHVNPEEAVQLFEDVQGRLLVPMHWGTFALNREPFREPPDRLLAEALRRGLEERVALLSPGQTIPW